MKRFTKLFALKSYILSLACLLALSGCVGASGLSDKSKTESLLALALSGFGTDRTPYVVELTGTLSSGGENLSATQMRFAASADENSSEAQGNLSEFTQMQSSLGQDFGITLKLDIETDENGLWALDVPTYDTNTLYEARVTRNGVVLGVLVFSVQIVGEEDEDIIIKVHSAGGDIATTCTGRLKAVLLIENMPATLDEGKTKMVSFRYNRSRGIQSKVVLTAKNPDVFSLWGGDLSPGVASVTLNFTPENATVRQYVSLFGKPDGDAKSEYGRLKVQAQGVRNEEFSVYVHDRDELIPGQVNTRDLGETIHINPGFYMSGTPRIKASNGKLYVAWDECTRVGALFFTSLCDFYVKTWNGSAWVQLGGAVNDSRTGISRDYFLSMDGDYPVLAWTVDTFFYPGRRIIVKKWNGSTWDTLAETPNSEKAFYPFVAVDGSNLLLGRLDNIMTGSISTYDIVTEVFDGSTWASMARLHLSAVSYPVGEFRYPRIYTGGAQPIMTYKKIFVQDQNSPREKALIVSRWNGTAWEDMGAPLNNTTDFEESNFHHGELALDSNATPFVAWAPLNLSKFHTAKWNGSSWVDLGDIPRVHSSIRYFVADVANDRPVVAWTETHNYMAQYQSGQSLRSHVYIRKTHGWERAAFTVDSLTITGGLMLGDQLILVGVEAGQVRVKSIDASGW